MTTATTTITTTTTTTTRTLSTSRTRTSLLAAPSASSAAPGGEKPLADNFQVEHLVGKGAFGKVYKAYDRVNYRHVAIKVFNVDKCEEDLTDLQDEISIMSTCKHPNITEHFMSFFRGHHLWIVMEFVNGGSSASSLRTT
ncbi:hypothetical protein DRE_07699 [Drechslerella stenobrocha 248]|uniref:non-specific serine/threonine protein kinase n=1 Tax=Drechslerella stenobrocha 248 TaxID=1043628 RepID=W7I3U7_9PEZI|nr:hypothetical protein DRE_07699 [Drechslerella stenobrocha 248]